jgi:hypothetical protein
MSFLLPEFWTDTPAVATLTVVAPESGFDLHDNLL